MSSSPSRSSVPIDKVAGNIEKEKKGVNLNLQLRSEKARPSDASTLILISPDVAKNNSPFEYRTLLLKRSSKSSFMVSLHPWYCLHVSLIIDKTVYSVQGESCLLELK